MSKCSNHQEILLSSLLLCYYNAIGYADNVLFLLDSSKDNIVQYYWSTCSLVHVPVLIEDILNQIAYCFWIVAGLVIVSVINLILLVLWFWDIIVWIFIWLQYMYLNESPDKKFWFNFLTCVENLSYMFSSCCYRVCELIKCQLKLKFKGNIKEIND